MPTSTTTKERGLPAHTHEVLAILDGRQTQFRRVLSYQPDPEFTDFAGPEMYAPIKIRHNGEEYPGDDVFGIYSKDGQWGLPCPFGRPGDRLWVREKFSPYLHREGCWYWADGREARYDATIPKPSIHMPRWASRSTLEVSDVRVERVQEISEADVNAEGVFNKSELHLAHCGYSQFHPDHTCGCGDNSPEEEFAKLWDSINAKRGFGWDKNPWTWVASFKRIEPAEFL